MATTIHLSLAGLPEGAERCAGTAHQCRWLSARWQPPEATGHLACGLFGQRTDGVRLSECRDAEADATRQRDLVQRLAEQVRDDHDARCNLPRPCAICALLAEVVAR